LPYMMWIDQAPKHQVGDTVPWMHIEIVSPWRGPGLARFIAAAEVATGEYFNPVHPNDAAERLRALR
jgi:UDPglucose--hexose-1-phosphate uridylyltransferase